MSDKSKINYEYSDEESANLHSTPSQCISCVNRNSENPMKCRAFPDGIPMVIFANNFDHRFEFPGDNGIRWFPRTPLSENPLGPISLSDDS